MADSEGNSLTDDSSSSTSSWSSLARGSRRPIPAGLKDETYWRRRNRNNESARKSREIRKWKEEQRSVKAVQLERENMQLVKELARLRHEVEQLRLIVYQPEYF